MVYFCLNGTKLNVEVPLEQAWRPTKDLNRRPSIYEIDDDIFVVNNTNEGSISYRIQLLGLSFMGPQVCL